MSDPRFYLIGSVLIGLAEVLGAGTLHRNSGRISTLPLLLSFAELGWGVVSFLAWNEARGGRDLSAVPIWLPSLFLAYLCVSLVLGVIIARGEERIEEVRIPSWVIATGGLFGSAFALASATLLIGRL